MNYCFNADSARYVYSNPHKKHIQLYHKCKQWFSICLILCSICSFLSSLMLLFILQCFWFFIFVIPSPSMFVSGIVHVIFFLTIHSLHVHLYLKKWCMSRAHYYHKFMNLVRKKITMGMAGVRLKTKFIQLKLERERKQCICSILIN